MPLHVVVGINCEKGATTENQGSAVKYMGQGVYLDDSVSSVSEEDSCGSGPSSCCGISAASSFG